MTIPTPLNQPRDAGNWAAPFGTLHVSQIPSGAINLNVDGRRVVGPVQGFGQLWQKTFRVRLEATDIRPADVVRIWKEHFAALQPPQSRFFPSAVGTPGAVVLINASLMGSPVDTGMLVMYADDESFTLMTPQGHPESGWITFSAYEEDGRTIAQVQSISRANDPVYEIGFRLVGDRAQDKIWTAVLTALAAHFGVEGTVDLQKTLLDPRCQWSQARNVWHNAAIRSVFYMLAAPLRYVRGRLQGRLGA